MTDTKQPEPDLQEWVADLRADVDAARGELAEVRDLVGDPVRGAVARALADYTAAFGPARFAREAGNAGAELFARYLDREMEFFWDGMAGAALDAMRAVDR